MNEMNSGPALFFFLAIGSVSLFSFLAVARWVESRRREREAYYRAEVFKKVAETQSAGSTGVLDFLREQERIDRQRRKEQLKLSGLVALAVGIGLMAFLRAIEHGEPVYLVGLIPVLIGFARFVHGYMLMPRG